jgi:hypothetical protein
MAYPSDALGNFCLRCLLGTIMVPRQKKKEFIGRYNNSPLHAHLNTIIVKVLDQYTIFS